MKIINANIVTMLKWCIQWIDDMKSLASSPLNCLKERHTSVNYSHLKYSKMYQNMLTDDMRWYLLHMHYTYTHSHNKEMTSTKERNYC